MKSSTLVLIRRLKWKPLGLVTLVYLGAWGLARAQVNPTPGGESRWSCSTLKQQQLSVNGLQFPIYEISSYKYLACLPSLPQADWIVRKSRWGADDQTEWKRFLTVLGESKCNTLEKCLKNPASNTLWSEWDSRMVFYADCADFPYFLRAYFSFKRGLPFSMVTSYSARELTPEILQRQERARRAIYEQFQDDSSQLNSKLEKFEELIRDHRYPWNGNYPVRRYFIPDLSPERRSFPNVVRAIRDQVSTGTYRMFEAPGEELADFYSPAIQLESIGPGTVLYKPAGHAAIVYKVTNDGSIYFVDAHPDNSVGRGQFNREYTRSNPNFGGGFKNWRPFVLMQKQGDKWIEARPVDGQIRNAHFRFLTDEEITYQSSLGGCAHRDRRSFPCDYSDEQYRGTVRSEDGDYRKAKFVLDGREVDYFDYIRFKLSGGRTISPVESFRSEMQALCDDLKGREVTVQTALNAQLDRRTHPGVYPQNIYGADGEWEDYSSPGRDVRIRGRVGQLANLAKHFMEVVKNNDPTYTYQSDRSVNSREQMNAKLANLKADFIHIYVDVSQSCEVRYVNSAGAEVRLPFEVALSRVSKMSFDPYLCVERRWGASQTAELKTCRDDAFKTEWYRLTQFLRNRSERDTAEIMGYTMDELRRMERGKKVDNRVMVDRFNLLNQLKAL